MLISATLNTLLIASIINKRIAAVKTSMLMFLFGCYVLKMQRIMLLPSLAQELLATLAT